MCFEIKCFKYILQNVNCNKLWISGNYRTSLIFVASNSRDQSYWRGTRPGNNYFYLIRPGEGWGGGGGGSPSNKINRDVGWCGIKLLAWYRVYRDDR